MYSGRINSNRCSSRSGGGGSNRNVEAKEKESLFCTSVAEGMLLLNGVGATNKYQRRTSLIIASSQQHESGRGKDAVVRLLLNGGGGGVYTNRRWGSRRRGDSGHNISDKVNSKYASRASFESPQDRIQRARIALGAHLTRYAVRRRKRIRNAVIVLLGMSHERESDRLRLVQLLQHFRYVVGVAIVEPPTTAVEYKQLAPYVRSGRYCQLQLDFENFRTVTAKSPNYLFELLQEKADLPERIVCLDYFFLQHPYYKERYGMNWLWTGGSNGRRGKVQQLLDFATCVYLPVDKHGLMKTMQQEYANFNGSPKTTMVIEPVTTTPLHASDKLIAILPDRPDADTSVALYLDPVTPFLKLRAA